MEYINRENLTKLLEELKKDYRVFVPIKKDEQRFYKEYDEFTEDIVIGEVRPFEPLKAFFTRAREKIAEDFSPEVPHADDKPFAIIGAKACDLKGFKVQDHVFLDHDYKDPFYTKLREENLIISSDCTCAIDTCYCLAVGVKPYPREDFDINLSEMDEGYLVEVGSEKGKGLLEKYSHLFQQASDRVESRRDDARENVIKEVEKNIKENEIPDEKLLKGVVEKNFESEIWDDEAKTCVECGACTIICPTCHCFFIYDQKDEDHLTRLRHWDSCMLKHYARVAGGENPREKLWMRLRNRFEKKFDFFPKVADVYACTGCGRCITACPAKIDIRKVLKRLVEGK
ncbi:4Fe-4S dicluster domain-containing protein [Candidatus Omnitrophota bacterium]